MSNVNALCRRALQEINVVAEGQDLSADALEKATNGWQGLYAELDHQGRAPFDYDDIPEWFCDQLAIMLASRITSRFHVAPEREATIYAKAWDRRNHESAINRYLRLLRSGTDDNDRPIEANYY